MIAPVMKLSRKNPVVIIPSDMNKTEIEMANIDSIIICLGNLKFFILLVDIVYSF